MFEASDVPKLPEKPKHKCRFLKSNYFINILQSFIHGYVIIYFFSATLQVSLFHAVWWQQLKEKK